MNKYKRVGLEKKLKNGVVFQEAREPKHYGLKVCIAVMCELRKRVMNVHSIKIHS